MLDESLLDSPEALARADTHGQLRAAAEAGAHVRTAARRAEESALSELRPDGRPRAVLVAGSGPGTACTADLLGAFTNGAMPVTLLRPYGPLAAPDALRWALPGWTGPLDLLIVATSDGTEPGLTALIEQAYRRGCTVVSVSPPSAPVAAMTGETHGLAVPLHVGADAVREPPSVSRPHSGGDGSNGQPTPPTVAQSASPAVLWPLVTPLLVLFDRLGLFPADPSALQSLADRLDHVAERCGPAVATYTNPAKSLATELTGTLPLLWTEGAVAGAVGHRCASAFAALPGLPVLTAALPGAMAEHSRLLAGSLAAASDPEDFFRDRVEEPESLRARVLFLREQATYEHSAAVAVRELTYAHEVPLSELEPVDGSSPLAAAAELIATVDFTAVYLALADGGPSWS
ncbi:SIS domain-containing protein [Streptomyces ovatisporus]|uniref:SIS domain-containing protein n=1 Tax=Streptomyces ovatisporus TaxID=1128682 RepID=A0ABV9A7S4_9ACTN